MSIIAGDWIDRNEKSKGADESEVVEEMRVLINTERLCIRFVTEQDWMRIKEIWEDFNASKYARYNTPHITDDAVVQQRIAKWASANSDIQHMFFAICLNDTVIGYSALNIRENGYEIGYCFHSAYHGKEYAKECHLALFDYLSGIGITRFIARTALQNIPSVSLLQSLGFQQIGSEKVLFFKDATGKDIVFDGGIFELVTERSIPMYRADCKPNCTNHL